MANAAADPDDPDDVADISEDAAGIGPATINPAAAQCGFTDFYNAAVPRLVAFLRWQGARLPDAADCVQDTMIDAYRRWATISHPYPYCRLAASRRYARLVAGTREDPTAEVKPTTVPLLGPEEALADLEERHSVLRKLDRLSSRQRQVLAWTYDGATPTEIAVALHITPDAVRATLYKARAKLRTYLAEEGGVS